MVGAVFGFFASAARCCASHATASFPVASYWGAPPACWLKATAGMPRRAAILAAPMVPESAVIGP